MTLQSKSVTCLFCGGNSGKCNHYTTGRIRSRRPLTTEPTPQFEIRRSVRYHDRRRRFYEVWNVVMVTVAVLGGSAATMAILAVGICSASRYGDLTRQFIVLQQRSAHGRNLGDAEYVELVRERLRIEMNEPSELRLPDVLCAISRCCVRWATQESNRVSRGTGVILHTGQARRPMPWVLRPWRNRPADGSGVGVPGTLLLRNNATWHEF